MATNYQMDPVVRRIEKSERHKRPDAIVVDVPLGDGWFAERWYYEVTRPRDGAGWAAVTVARDLEAGERNWRLPIQIVMRVQFSGSGEADARRLVTALRDADNPDRGMSVLVGRWLDRFASAEHLGSTELVEGFLRYRDRLKSFLIGEAALVSLALTRIDIFIRGEAERRNVLEIRMPHFLVVLSDYKAELSLALDADLRLLPESVMAFLPAGSRDTVDRDLRASLRELFRTSITLHQWQFDLQGDVRSRVDATVREVAARAGREVARLMIAAEPPIPGVQRSIDVEILKEQFRQLDYPDPVEVDLAMRLDLVNLGALVNSAVHPGSLQEWARQAMRDAITHQLLDEAYVDLFDRFQDKLAKTELALKAAARSIGYRLARIATKTNLDFDVLQRGFECHIENATFPLALRECEVVLDIDTRLRIVDRGVLRAQFRKHTGITHTVAERIRSTVATELRQISPEEFYLRFHGDEKSPETSVAARLEAAIRIACAEFKPEGDLNVHFALRIDELMKVYQLLVRTPISLVGLQDPNSQVIVDVRAAVTQIYGEHWRRFQELKPTPERVAETVSEHIVSFINEMSRTNFRSLMEAGGPAVSTAAERWVNVHLARDLGLGVSIGHWFMHDELVGGPLGVWKDKMKMLLDSARHIAGQLRNAYVQDESAEVIRELEAKSQSVQRAIDTLYAERGGASILVAKDPSFRLQGPSLPSVLALPAVSGDEEPQR